MTESEEKEIREWLEPCQSKMPDMSIAIQVYVRDGKYTIFHAMNNFPNVDLHKVLGDIAQWMNDIYEQGKEEDVDADPEAE